MRKILAILCAVVLLLSVISCTRQPTDSSPTSSDPTDFTSTSSGTVTVVGDMDMNGRAEKTFIEELRSACALDNSYVVAYINGEPLYKRDFLAFKAAWNLNVNKYLDMTPNAADDDPYLVEYRRSDEQLLHEFIIRKVALKEAKKAGVKVDEEQVRRGYAENFDYQVQNLGEWITANAEARGLTVEEYKELSIEGAVTSAIISTYMDNICPLTDYEDFYARDNAFKEEIEKALEKYNITVIK